MGGDNDKKVINKKRKRDRRCDGKKKMRFV